MTGYLLDTNVISELTKPAPEAQVIEFLTANDDLWLPSIVMYELELGLQILPDGGRRERLRSVQSSLLEEYKDRIIPIGQREAEMTAILQADARKAGQTVALADALVAGTARVHDLIVVSRNVRDFAPLSVTIHNPWLK
ncbi:MAG: PIN domain-containing protein [Chloroflexota bacterium]|nr:PIN domain-containing protein [Chloroflexota bacterium]